MFFIDNDQAQLGKGQEEGRTRADQHSDFALCNGAPGKPSPSRGDFAVPFGRWCAEAPFKSIEPLARQSNFRLEDQYLSAFLQGSGDGFEVDLCLTGTGDAVEQRS